MYNNWLVKLCAEQPKQDANVAQQLEQLTIDEIKEVAQPEPTSSLNSLQEKIAAADKMGRELAHEQGAAPAQQAETAALEQQAIAKAISELPDDEAIKVAYVLEHGSEKEKQAFLGALKGLVGGAAKRGLQSGAGSRIAATAVRHPTAALAVGGGLASKATGGDFMPGAAMGAGAGLLGGGRALQRGLMKAPQALAKFAEAKTAMLDNCVVKSAFHHDGHPNEWLQQFEGTPLLQHAIGMEKQILEAEKADLEKRVQDRQRRAQERMEHAEQDKLWDVRDRLGMDKKLLELQLIAHRNGISEPDGDELGGEATTADHPEPDGDENNQVSQQNPAEAAVASQPGQEAVNTIKEAAAKVLPT